MGTKNEQKEEKKPHTRMSRVKCELGIFFNHGILNFFSIMCNL